MPEGESAIDLQEVARRIARAIAEAEASPAKDKARSLVFRVGALRLSLPLTALKEVVLPPPSLSKVPRAPEAVLGIMNLRGRVVTVVDLWRALPPEIAGKAGATPPPPGQALDPGRILLLDRHHREIGLFVRAVDGIEPLTSAPSPVDPDALGRALESLVA